MRLFISMETGDDRYAELINGGMWIGSGFWNGNSEGKEGEKRGANGMGEVVYELVCSIYSFVRDTGKSYMDY